MAGVQFPRCFQRSSGVLKLAKFQIHTSQIAMGVHKFRLRPERRFQTGDGLLKPAGLLEGDAEIVVCRRTFRFKFYSFLAKLRCLFISPASNPRCAEITQGLYRPGVQRQCRMELCRRVISLAVFQQGRAKIVESLRIGGIKRHRFAEKRLRLVTMPQLEPGSPHEIEQQCRSRELFCER